MPELPSIPLGSWIADIINWLTDNVAALFDGIHAILEFLGNIVYYVLTLPHPYLLTAILAAIALVVKRKPGLPIFTIIAFLLIDSMGYWERAMQTLALVIVATVIAVAIGVPVGIWAAKSGRASVIVRPVLDFMQTLPVFVYLLPAVFFFGIGVAPGIVATIIFAIPPGVRLTELGIRQVDREVVEAAHAFGSKPSQILREVQIPLAMPSIMAGVNQVIMLALSMVVVAALVGAPGLGIPVVAGMQSLNIAQGFEGGISVVILAIYLDRLTGGLADLAQRRGRKRSKAPRSPGDTADEEREMASAMEEGKRGRAASGAVMGGGG
ncbi:MAG: ABC transporter permease [Streptosporangiales bacterium]